MHEKGLHVHIMPFYLLISTFTFDPRLPVLGTSCSVYCSRKQQQPSLCLKTRQRFRIQNQFASIYEDMFSI